MKNNLIFDLGFFNGDDTAYYLKKGYKVVAVEANHELYKKGLERFAKEVKSRDLMLLHRVFHRNSDIKTFFYIHPKNPDWSTADKSKAEYLNINTSVEVLSVNYYQLQSVYGTPYYVKCDIEGFDYLLIQQVCDILEKPEYLSFELSRLDYFKTFSYLYVAGYTGFQLINQGNNKLFCSGDFGELLPNKWINFDECLTRYMKYKELKEIDNVNLALGWIDIHAKI
jgi:FkbM family methyltransferase